MSKEWNFHLALNRQLTTDEIHMMDTSEDLPLFADGSVSYTTGGPDVSELYCDVMADSLSEAIARVADEIGKVNPLLVMRVIHETP